MNLNPIVALAGAAHNTGMRMFANQLLNVQGGVVSTTLYIANDPTLKGLSDNIVAAIVDDRIKYGVSAL